MTTYNYEVQGLYCDGWECATTAETKLEAKQLLQEYRTHEWGVAFRVKRVAVLAEPQCACARHADGSTTA